MRPNPAHALTTSLKYVEGKCNCVVRVGVQSSTTRYTILSPYLPKLVDLITTCNITPQKYWVNGIRLRHISCH